VLGLFLVVSSNVQAPNLPLTEKPIVVQGNSVVGLSPVPINFNSLGVLGDFYDKIDIIYLLKSAAEKYGLNEKRFTKLAFCESSLNHDQWGDLDLKYPVYGLFQYQQRTWDRYCEGDIKSEKDQIECAGKLIGQGKSYLWSCPY